VIRVVNSAYEGWWKGELDGRIGIFPLTYIEIIPDPTPESIARDAETEAQVFAQAGSVDRLLAMLSAADAQGSSISDDDDLMELYQQCILLRPKIVKLLDKYNQKQRDLSSLHDKFKVAKTAYDTMLEESYQKNQRAGPYSGQPGYGPSPTPAYQQNPGYGYAQPQQQPPHSQAAGPPQSYYSGQAVPGQAINVPQYGQQQAGHPPYASPSLQNQQLPPGGVQSYAPAHSPMPGHAPQQRRTS